MIDLSPRSLAFGGTAPGRPVPRAALRAYLALLAGLGGAATGLMLLLSVAANSGSEAERIADARDDGYAATLVGALAVSLSQPLR